MSPLSTLAVPSLRDVADQTVSLYSALLDDRLNEDVSTVTADQVPARGNDQEAESRALEETR